MGKYLVDIKNERLSFFTPAGEVKALNDVTIHLEEGEVLGIVGESGSGKSVFTKTFTGMLESNGMISNGSVMFHGTDLTKLKKDKEWEGILGNCDSKVFLGSSENETCEYFSKLLGNQTIVIRNRSRSLSAKGGNASQSFNYNKRACRTSRRKNFSHKRSQ